jgi:hypothetical protein
MKKFTFLFVLVTFGFVAIVEAQFREDINSSNDYTGAIFKTEQSQNSTLGNLMSSINMSMSHSYSMNFGSVGGQFQNLNAYTNHMTFDFSENLTGHVDLSVLHSPFGNSFMNMGNNSLGARLMIDRAQLDYKLSPNSSISIQFSQRPYYSPYRMSPNGMNSMYGTRNQFWY